MLVSRLSICSYSGINNAKYILGFFKKQKNIRQIKKSKHVLQHAQSECNRKLKDNKLKYKNSITVGTKRSIMHHREDHTGHHRNQIMSRVKLPHLWEHMID